ncbi:conjugal transfer protein TraD [Phenylobacterium sp. J367]|uniref:conjugal transfer protein TraD n=1 Tax=Phenylobacterium sp. J367 TaxID=2898435 RepID=UPI0021509088|nr:conjugal transfer protein TraD [Phenylobacterium sp. J367]MCR5877292.1 conjugal transfer protein TraD [Phenylobacterium sp. J367]
MQRRERTRQLIELGGLVAKAGLVDLAGDDRAALYGAFLELADRLKAADGEGTRLLWRRRGQRAFASEAEAQG